MFAAGSAAEVSACQQNRGPADGRSIQFERRVGGPVVLIPPVEEQKLSEAGALDPLEKLLRDDLIGIHVRSVHHGDNARVLSERLHGDLNRGENRLIDKRIGNFALSSCSPLSALSGPFGIRPYRYLRCHWRMSTKWPAMAAAAAMAGETR